MTQQIIFQTKSALALKTHDSGAGMAFEAKNHRCRKYVGQKTTRKLVIIF